MLLMLAACVGDDYDPADFPEEITAAAKAVIAEGVLEAKEAITQVYIHGFLSRVEYGGNVAYIMGSMHLGRPDWFPLAAVVQEAMEKADVFAFEADFSLMETEAVSQRMMQRIFLPGGQTLRDFLPDDIFEHFYKMLATYPNVDYDMLAYFTPAYASYFISLKEAMPLMELEATYSVDMYIMDFAMNNEMPIIGLNDIFRELNMAFDWPEEVQFSAMAQFTDYTTFLEEINELGLADAYEAQDAQWIYREAIAPLREAARRSLYGEFMYDTILIERSTIFAEEIIRRLRGTTEPTTFFVTIGAAHVLSGHVFGVLEDSGFGVVPVWQQGL